MKTFRFVATLGAVGLLATPFALATESATDNPVRSSAAPQQRSDATVSVPVLRATDFIGTDVLSSDGHKVGDVVDFMFDTEPPARVAYVIVMTGGLLELRGQTRAVPPSAITFTDSRARLPLTRDQFMATPAITGSREEFLKNPQYVSQITQAFNVDPNDVPRPNDRLLAFYSLLRSNVYSPVNGRLGYVRDAWFTLTPERVPYIDMNPMFNPFEINSEDFAIPLARLQSADRSGLTFDIRIEDLTTAPLMTGTQFADPRLPSNAIVRLTPAEAAVANKEIVPTGPATPAPTASARAVTAAEAVRAALDRDPSLRQQNVQVMARGDTVILRGSVSDGNVRARVASAAATAAGAVTIADEINSPTP